MRKAGKLELKHFPSLIIQTAQQHNVPVTFLMFVYGCPIIWAICFLCFHIFHIIEVLQKYQELHSRQPFPCVFITQVTLTVLGDLFCPIIIILGGAGMGDTGAS